MSARVINSCPISIFFRLSSLSIRQASPPFDSFTSCFLASRDESDVLACLALRLCCMPRREPSMKHLQIPMPLLSELDVLELKFQCGSPMWPMLLQQLLDHLRHSRNDHLCELLWVQILALQRHFLKLFNVQFFMYLIFRHTAHHGSLLPLWNSNEIM